MNISSPDKISCVVIGPGGYGEKICSYLGELQGVEIQAVFHPNWTKCKRFGAKWNCTAIKDLSAFLKSNKNLALIIASPDDTHLKYIEMGIKYQHHIFVEKPVVGKWKEIKYLEPKLKNFSKQFHVGHNTRLEKGIEYIKSNFNSGAFGKLVSFNIQLSHGGIFNWDKNYWRTQKLLCREGPLRVNGVHASDVLEYLFGPIELVQAIMQNLHSPFSAPDTGIALVGVNGCFGTISTCWNIPSLSIFQFFFTDAIAEFDLKSLKIRLGRDINCIPSKEKLINLPPANSRIEQFRSFFASIKGDTSPLKAAGWNEGKRAVMFTEACYRSQELNAFYNLKWLEDQ